MTEKEKAENEKKLLQMQAQDAEIEKQEQQKKDSAKEFNPDSLLKETSEIYIVQDEVLGAVKYGKLSMKEYNSFKKYTDIEERSFRLSYAMLAKAYPKLTFEEFETWSFDKMIRLSNLLSKEGTRFLPKTP
jgi:hypothetical protein